MLCDGAPNCCLRLSLSHSPHNLLILPYFKHVDRYEYQRRHSYRPYPLSAVRDITRQVFEALAFMHTLELVHTDIKPENICLVRDSERERLKVGQASAKQP